MLWLKNVKVSVEWKAKNLDQEESYKNSKIEEIVRDKALDSANRRRIGVGTSTRPLYCRNI